MSLHDTIISRKTLLGGGVATAAALAFAAPASATPYSKHTLSTLVSYKLGAALTAKATLLGIKTQYPGFTVDLTQEICDKHKGHVDSIVDDCVEQILCRPPHDHEKHPDHDGGGLHGGWGSFTSPIWCGLPTLGSFFVHQKFSVWVKGSYILGCYPTGSSWGSHGSWNHSSSWSSFLWASKGVRTYSKGWVSFSLGGLHVSGQETCHADWKASGGKLISC